MPFNSIINIINKTGFIMTLDLPLPSPTFGVYYTAPVNIPIAENCVFVVGADTDDAKGSQGKLSYTIGNPASYKAEVSYVCNAALNNNVTVDIPPCEFYATYGPPTDNQKKQIPLTASATIHRKEH